VSPSVSIRAGRAIDPFAHMIQYPHAHFHVACWNVVNQLVTQLERGRINLINYALGPALQMHSFTTPIAC
jgi:hypothetical protein